MADRPEGVHVLIFAQAATLAGRKQLREAIMGRPPVVSDNGKGIITTPGTPGIPLDGGWSPPIYDATGTKMVWSVWIPFGRPLLAIVFFRRIMRLIAQAPNAVRIRVNEDDWREHGDIAWAERATDQPVE